MKVKVTAPQSDPLQFHWGGGAEVISQNPYSMSPTIEFKGPSHEKGGVGISFKGVPAEVEGNETGQVDNQGNLNIMGNMIVPGTQMKFKTASKKLARLENKAGKQMKTADDILTSHITDTSKFGTLANNAAYLMGWGATQKQKQLASQKQYLIDVQNAMLDTADEMGLDPQAMSKGSIKKAKYGANLGKYPQGGRLDPIALDNYIRRFGAVESSNNYNASSPGSSAYGRYQFTKATRDNIYKNNPGGFKRFGINNLSDFESAFKTNPEVQDDIMTLHLNHLNDKYNGNPQYIALAHRVGEGAADSLINKGYYTSQGKKITWDTPISASTTGTETPGDYVKKITGAAPFITPEPEPTPDINVPPTNELYTPSFPDRTPPIETLRSPSPSVPSTANTTTDYNIHEFTPPKYSPTPLPFSEIVPELVAFGENSREGVQGQSYTPRLYQPYQVSFQDQLNANQSDFKGLEEIGRNNPEYLSSLAANKYKANQSILGNEFRTNQQIDNSVYNNNIGLLNQAEQENLKLADQQYVRQETANSKTKAQTNVILNSIASKLEQNALENKQLAAYQSLYPYYKFDGQGNVNFVGPKDPINPMPKSSNGALIKALNSK